MSAQFCFFVTLDQMHSRYLIILPHKMEIECRSPALFEMKVHDHANVPCAIPLPSPVKAKISQPVKDRPLFVNLISGNYMCVVTDDRIGSCVDHKSIQLFHSRT